MCYKAKLNKIACVNFQCTGVFTKWKYEIHLKQSTLNNTYKNKEREWEGRRRRRGGKGLAEREESEEREKREKSDSL